MATSLLHASGFGGYRVMKIWNRHQSSSTNNHNASSFTYTISDDVPIIELPGASFDQYMGDRGRVIRAVIPERAIAQHLIEEDWRIKMPAVQALFQTVQPVIDLRLRCKTNGKDYPPHIPPHVTKLYEAHLTKWELQGVHADYMPTYLNFEATGILYPERKGRHSCIKSELNLNISVVFPPILVLVPKHMLHNILDSLIAKFVEDVKRGCRGRLIADYSSFKLKWLSKNSK